MADRVSKERNWRFGYRKWVVRNVDLACRSPEDCLKIARAGLDYAHSQFEFVRDGKTMSIAQAMDGRLEGTFHTGFIKGDKPKPAKFELEVPYKGSKLKGEALRAQLQRWVEVGTIEPTARDAIQMVADHPGMLDLSGHYFVLLGAGSAMGPLLLLLSLGANIIAIDLDREGIWKRLIGLARDSCGTLTFPVAKSPEGLTDAELAKVSGSNLFTQTPEIRNWLLGVHKGQPLTIGGYAYLDGARHVQVSLAMDAIMKGVSERRKGVSLGFLCSPTDVFVAPEEARQAQLANLKAVPFWQPLLGALSCGKMCVPNKRSPTKTADGKALFVVDNIIEQQGPNYALAKRLQHWRAMVHRAEGGSASSNIAPSTATVSVVHNKMFALAYAGFKYFKPMEVFYQETSNAVMGTLLIHDVRNPNGVSNPQFPLNNPLELFASGAFHGGMWRTGYAMNSCGEAAAVGYLVSAYWWVIGAAAAGCWYVSAVGLPFDLP